MNASCRCFLFVLAWVSPVLVSAHPSSVEIAATWTGLEFNAHAGGTRVFTLELASDPAPPSGQRLSGTWTSRPVARDRKGRQPPPQVETVAADYFPDTGILRVNRRPQQGGRGYDVLVVFDAEVRRLAGVYTGGWKDMTPFYAVRGAALSPELLGATGLARGQLVAEVVDASRPAADWRAELAAAMASGDYERARGIVEQQGRAPAVPGGGTAAPTARDFETELMVLQTKTQEAAARGDVDEIKRLQQQMRELRTEVAAQRQRGAAPTPAPASVRAATRCPEHLVAWAAQLDAHGGSVAHFEGNNQLANLFRPRYFTPFFGQPFAVLSPDERAKIAGDLQRSCVNDGTPFGSGSAIGAMISAFQDTPGYSVAEAGLGGLALELIADWNLRSVQALDGETGAAHVTNFENQSQQLIGHLFARERDDTRRQLTALKSRNHGQRLLAEIDGLGRAAASGNADAMVRLVQLPRHADAVKLAAGDRAPFDEKHARILAETVAVFIRHARAEALAPPPGLDQLLRSKAWLGVYGEALNVLRGRPPADDFHRDFLAARAASYAAEKPRMAREIAALDSRDALVRYPAPFVIYSDPDTAPAWKEIDAQLNARVQEFERREFFARTGDGPFGPDYPGAVYLNALWRNDQAQLEELDRRYREPYLAQLGMLEQIDYTPDLAERISGGAISADKYRRQRRALSEEASLANPLLVLFAFEYEHVYETCMDPEPVEFRVQVRHESIMRNGFGMEVGRYPAGTSTIVHHVNQRHADAVRDLGIADPNDRVATEAFLGGYRSPVSYVRAGSGLAQAMRDHACDSDVIRRLETGLLTRWQTFAERKRDIRQRILGQASN